MANAVTTKTALNIDRNLVALAAQILGTSGTTATVDAALRDVVERAARDRLLGRIRQQSSDDRAAILTAWH
jgi:Arc/MetJ family transcription regulator